jgi:hypothetical protein
MPNPTIDFANTNVLGREFGLEAANKYTQGYSLWAAAAGLILAGIGAAKQYEMYGKMGDLAAANQKLVDAQRVRYEKLMDSVFLPNLLKAKENLWGYAMPFAKSITEAVIECATQTCNYTRRKGSSLSAAGKVAASINAARRAFRRSANPRATGVCQDGAVRLAGIQAALLVSEASAASKYEDGLELQWNQFYWNRQLAAAQLAQRIGELGANLAQGAGSQLSNVLGGLGQTLSIGQQGIQQQSAGISGQAGVFGGLGSLGGLVTGNTLGLTQGNAQFGQIGRLGQIGNGTGVTGVTGGTTVDSLLYPDGGRVTAASEVGTNS